MKKSILLTLHMIILMPIAFNPAKAQDELVFVAVDPCRIVDTREAGGAINANNFRNFQVSGSLGELAVQGGKTDCLDPKAGTGQKPLAISAYVITVPTTSTNSILTAYPSDQLPPPVGAGSTVNSATGQVIGNTTNITLCDPSGSCPTDGEFAVLARNTNQHVVVDVQGYFYPATSARDPVAWTTPFDRNEFVNIDSTGADILVKSLELPEGIYFVLATLRSTTALSGTCLLQGQPSSPLSFEDLDVKSVGYNLLPNFEPQQEISAQSVLTLQGTLEISAVSGMQVRVICRSFSDSDWTSQQMQVRVPRLTAIRMSDVIVQE